MKNILRGNGYDPGTKRGLGTWDEFITIHASTLGQCDFLCKRSLTPKGFRDLFVIVFLHVGSRRVFITPATAHPNDAWVQKQASDFLKHVKKTKLPAEVLMHDRDTKFTAKFCDIIESDGPKFVEIAPRSPNMNPHAERWVQTVRRECLDHFLVLGERHLRHLLSVFLSHYHSFRPHQSLGNGLIVPSGAMPEEVVSLAPAKVICRAALGGLLNHYERRAA